MTKHKSDKNTESKQPAGDVETAQENGAAGQPVNGAAGEQIGEQNLADELAQVKAQADEYLDGWQRARAEFANYKKRMDREQAQAYQNAAGNILKRFLMVVDDLERALKARPNDGDGAAWADGVELIYRKLLQLLESEGVVVLDAENQMFDPNLHEAVVSEDNPDYESGQIIEVLQQGYRQGERVLRPAVVRVAR